MADLVYPPVILAARASFRMLDLRIDMSGTRHVPRRGGAVLVSNHISYVDFIFCGLATLPAKRFVRFMAKKPVFDHKVSGPLMRGMHHIPVDRADGQGAFQHALRALRSGEIVGVFPEATISRSFTLKQFKSGPARLALQAGVPLLPVAVWGTQRLWTKGHPRNFRRRHIPLVVRVGEALHLQSGDKPVMVTRRLRQRIAELLAEAQRSYPAQPAGPEDSWWQPAHLGGSAPTPEEVAADSAV